MRNYLQRGWVISLLIFSISAFAEAPALSQDFWEYMADFDDEGGDVLDPVEYDQLSKEYDQLSNLKNDAVVDAIEYDSTGDSEQKINSQNRNTDMKLKTQTSAQSSSVMMKGTTL